MMILCVKELLVATDAPLWGHSLEFPFPRPSALSAKSHDTGHVTIGQDCTTIPV